MDKLKLAQKIADRLRNQVAFGGMTKRKTIEGEVILKGDWDRGDLESLANNLTDLFTNYVAEMSLNEFKIFIKNVLE